MPAVSELQRRATAAALAAKRGKMSASDLGGPSRQMFSSMNENQLSDFAQKPVTDEHGFRKYQRKK